MTRRNSASFERKYLNSVRSVTPAAAAMSAVRAAS
jgi:hypothetical protein